MPEPEATIRVESPGLFATVQDLGRPGRRAAGIPPGGAMDRFALAAANRLVGNPDGAGALECALTGPLLVARRNCTLAVTGADFQPTLNGDEMPSWESVFLVEGDRLGFRGRRWGARCYIAVAGGIAGDRWLGSVSTYLLVNRGGIHGRPLKAGDELSTASEPARPSVSGRALPPALRPPYSNSPVLAVVPGPHARRMAAASRRAFHSATYLVSRNADRMGYRLEGPALAMSGSELLSFGLAAGCVQVPGSGQPILLMADHQTAGGYPVVAGVARADLPLAAQLLPGEGLEFRETTVVAAQARWRGLRAGLETLA